MSTFRVLILIIALFQAHHIYSAEQGAYLGNLTWPEAKEWLQKAPVVIVPFGAGAKEHGPHLPMNADFKVVEYLCKKAVESHSVIVAPPIQHGWFPAFRQFPGLKSRKAMCSYVMFFLLRSLWRTTELNGFFF